jgi:Na+-transporting NADH:ubiquinone oxidoreductase subunit NqrD
MSCQVIQLSNSLSHPGPLETHAVEQRLYMSVAMMYILIYSNIIISSFYLFLYFLVHLLILLIILALVATVVDILLTPHFTNVINIQANKHTNKQSDSLNRTQLMVDE